MASERVDEEVLRIMNCVNSCWPEYSFTYMDFRKPSGEKFRDILGKFLQGFLSCQYQIPSINMHEYTRNPQMFVHCEGPMSLYRNINSILKSLGYNNFLYGDLLRPTPNVVRDVLLCLVNFLAYFEAEEVTKDDVETEILLVKNKTQQMEKELEDKERDLHKCRQYDEEKKIFGIELRKLAGNRKEKCLTAEASVGKLNSEVDASNKRVQNINARLEQATSTLKQVELEKEKAAEAVVPDPEELEAELSRSQQDKENMEEDFACLKSRLPVLEQQIQDRTLQLQLHTETHQRITQFKARELKIKLEWQKGEVEYRQVEEEKEFAVSNLKKETSLIESKMRMFDDYNQKVEQLKSQLEKARFDVKQCMSDKEARDLQLQAEFSALDNEISQLTQELKSGQKALDEGVGVFEAIHLKHQRDLEEFRENHQKVFESMQHMVNNSNLPTFRSV